MFLSVLAIVRFSFPSYALLHLAPNSVCSTLESEDKKE